MNTTGTMAARSPRWAALKLAVMVAAAAISISPVAATAAETITFWHSMSGRLGDALQALVDGYNKENAGKVQVEAVFQGSYNDSLSKLKVAVQAGATPNIVQVNEIGSSLVHDLQITVPLADLAPAAGIDTNAFLTGISTYYTLDGKLQSLPFNASAPMLFINKDAFKEAGLDPNSPPKTLAELRAAADKLVVKDGGTTSRYGYVSAVDGWLAEQLFARAEENYCNNGNGREARATEVNWENPVMYGILDFWGDIMRDGVGLNAGRVNTDAVAAFTSGRAAMLVMTSALLRDIVDGSSFDVGVAPYPSPVEGKTGAVFNGGASIWVLSGHPAEQQTAAVDFLKYLGSKDSQGVWSASTGYIPVNTEAADTQAFKDVLAKYADFAKPREQLAQAGTTPASRGCLMGVMPQARARLNDAVDAVISGSSTPEQAAADGARDVKVLIDSYNQSVGN